MSTTREDVYEIIEKIQSIDSTEYLDSITRAVNERSHELAVSMFYYEEEA